MFINLTDNCEKQIYLQVEAIVLFRTNYKDDSLTEITTVECTGEDYWLVKETPGKILELIEEAKGAEHGTG